MIGYILTYTIKDSYLLIEGPLFFVNYILFQYYANMRSYCIVRLYFVFVMCTRLCAGYNFRDVFENLEATKLHSCGIINALFDIVQMQCMHAFCSLLVYLSLTGLALPGLTRKYPRVLKLC